MKIKSIIRTATALAVACSAAYAQQTLNPKRGTIWVSWEEDGHQWMVGALKEYAKAQDDPGFVQTDFGKGYAVKVQGASSTGNGILFHNCCTTNISIGTNYTGTITVGTNIFKVSELLKTPDTNAPISARRSTGVSCSALLSDDL